MVTAFAIWRLYAVSLRPVAGGFDISGGMLEQVQPERALASAFDVSHITLISIRIHEVAGE